MCTRYYFVEDTPLRVWLNDAISHGKQIFEDVSCKKNFSVKYFLVIFHSARRD